MNGLRRRYDSQPWYRQFWPWALIALPGLTVVFSIAVVVIAVRNADSLVRDDYYKAGLAINQQRTLAQEALRQHLHAELSINGESHLIEVRLQGAALTPPSALMLDLHHPTLAERDCTTVLGRRPDGVFSGPLEVVPQGSWHVRLSPAGQGNWQLSARLDLSQHGPHAIGAAQ